MSAHGRSSESICWINKWIHEAVSFPVLLISIHQKNTFLSAGWEECSAGFLFIYKPYCVPNNTQFICCVCSLRFKQLSSGKMSRVPEFLHSAFWGGETGLKGDTKNFFKLLSPTYGKYRRRQWHPTPVLLPGKSHGWRSLEGCSPWGHWGLDMTDFTFTFHFHALEKEMATHSSVLAWRIPGTGSLVDCRLWGHTESDTTEVT